MQDRANRPQDGEASQAKAALLMALLGPEKLAALRAQGLSVNAALPKPDFKDRGTAQTVSRQEAQDAARLLLAKLAARPKQSTPENPPENHDMSDETYPKSDAAGSAPEGAKTAAPAPKPMPKPVTEIRKIDRDALQMRLAGLVTPQSLAGEHPAVIAHILWPQDGAARSNVLRALPGPVARAVMRQLRHLSDKA